MWEVSNVPGPGRGKLVGSSGERSAATNGREELVVMRRYPIVLVVLAVTASLCAASPGGEASWSCLGPPGAGIRQVAVAGSGGRFVYASSGPALWRSTDGGVHFTRVMLPAERILSLAAAREQPRTVWLLVQGWEGTGGSVVIVVSEDAGLSWRIVKTLAGGSGDADFSGLIIDPLQEGAVDFVRNTAPFAVVRLARDGTLTRLAPIDGPAVALAAARDGVLYVATFSEGFFRRNEPCGRWFKLRNPGVSSPLALAVDPDDASVVLAGGFDGLKLSTDRGAGWRMTAVDGWVTSVAFDPADSDVVWCTTTHRLWVSTDAGRTWRTASVHGPLLNQAVPDPGDPSSVFVATGAPPDGWDHAGLIRSIDLGATFGAADSGISGTRVTDLLALAGSRLAGRAWGGVVTWDPQAGSRKWTFAEPHGWDPVDAIGADTASGRLFAATDIDTGGGAGDALFVSPGGMRAWTRRSEVAVGIRFSSLALDPAGASRMFAGGRSGIFVVDLGNGSWRSLVGRDRPVETVVALASAPGVVLAAGGEVGVLRSTDGGATWQQASGVPVGGDGTWELEASKAGPVFLLAGTAGVFTSDDAGLTWTAAALPSGTACTAIAISPLSGNELFAACPPPAGAAHGPGLWQSLDGGSHWFAVPGPPEIRAVSVRVDPDDPDIVFCPTRASGVWSVRLQPRLQRMSKGTGRPVERCRGDTVLKHVH